jgi:hypothetical protein
MYQSKFKRFLVLSVLTIGFYIFWCFAYYILARYGQSEWSTFMRDKAAFWKGFKAGDIFWYLIYLGGIALSMYFIYLFVIKSPMPKIAAIIYGILLIASEGYFLTALSASNSIKVIPHVAINVCFLAAIVIGFFSKEQGEA